MCKKKKILIKFKSKIFPIKNQDKTPTIESAFEPVPEWTPKPRLESPLRPTPESAPEPVLELASKPAPESALKSTPDPTVFVTAKVVYDWEY